MKCRFRSQKGYSLVEMLVVLAIVAILTFVGLNSLGNRPSAAVRATLDEIEGVIMGAQKLSQARGGADVFLVARGVWNSNSADFFIIGYDIAKPVDVAAAGVGGDVPTQTVNRIINYSRNPAAAPLGDAPEGVFRLQFNPNTHVISRDQENAGVVVFNSPWWATALGTAADLSTLAPGNLPPISNAIAPATNLAQGAASNGVNNVAIVSGLNKRWIRDFHIRVVGLRGGNALPDGPVGFLVVPANSGSVYKFINPGKKDNDGNWRRM